MSKAGSSLLGTTLVWTQARARPGRVDDLDQVCYLG